MKYEHRQIWLQAAMQLHSQGVDARSAFDSADRFIKELSDRDTGEKDYKKELINIRNELAVINITSPNRGFALQIMKRINDFLAED